MLAPGKLRTDYRTRIDVKYSEICLDLSRRELEIYR